MASTITTLDQLLNSSSRYDINKITYYTLIDDLVIPETTVFDVYMRYIEDYIGEFKVSDKQREYYKFKPDLLANDIYGTSELSWLVLRLNDIDCASRFKIKRKIKLISPDNLDELYDSIIAKAGDKLKANWNEFLVLVQ